MLRTIAFASVAAAAIILGNTASAQVGAKKPSDERAKQLLDEAGLKYTVDKDGDFRLLYEFEDGRTHLVFVNSRTSTYRTMEVREVWAVACQSDRLPENVLRRLLEQNSELKIGAWTVVSGKEKQLAVFVVQLAADTDAKSLVTALQAVSTTADEMEEELTGEDEN